MISIGCRYWLVDVADEPNWLRFEYNKQLIIGWAKLMEGFKLK